MGKIKSCFRLLLDNLLNPDRFFLVSVTTFSLAQMLSIISYRTLGDSFVDGFNVPIGPIKAWDLSICYEGVSKILDGFSNFQGCGYPPMFSMFLIPFVYMDFTHLEVYSLYKYILVSLLFVSVYFAISLEEKRLNSTKIAIAALLTLTLTNTYPVLFALERSNHDITANFFSITAIFFLVRNWYKSAIAMLVIAVQFKIYPIILLSIFAVRAGLSRSIAFVVICIGCLFVLGPYGFNDFLLQISTIVDRPYVWKGNMSLYSFVTQSDQFGADQKEYWIGLYSYGLSALFAFSWCFYFFRYSNKKIRINRENQQQLTFQEIGLVGMSYQLMVLLPGTSHDYKSIILMTPLLFLFSAKLGQRRSCNFVAFLVVVTLSFCLSQVLLPIEYGTQEFKTPIVLASYFLFFLASVFSSSKTIVDRFLQARRNANI